MSRLDELRQRAAKSRQERRELYAQTVKEAVSKSLQDENLVMMSVLAQGGAQALDNPAQTEKIVNNITKSVVSTVTDYKLNFIKLCEARGIQKRRMHVAVGHVYDLFLSELAPPGVKSHMDVDFEAQLEAVALKLEHEPSLWETVEYLQVIEHD